MAEEKLVASLTPQQWDFVGRLVVDVLNSSTAQARMATAVWQALQGQLQPQSAPPPSNGLHAVARPAEDGPPAASVP